MVDDYSRRLAEAMQDAQTTTSELARRLSVSYQAVKKVLTGKSKSFSAAHNDEAAKVLRVSATWLATGRGPKCPDAPPPASVVHVRQPETPWPAAITIAQALDVLGAAIAALPDTALPELAAAMQSWCAFGGRDPWRRTVADLLQQPAKPAR